MTLYGEKQTQKGFSLMSLLVAVAIGLFLIGAVIKIYLDSKNSFSTRNVVAEVSENTRFALDDMRRILVMAGRGVRAIEDQFSNRRPFPEINASGIVDGGSSGSDTIAIRYRRGPSCGAYQNVSTSERPSMVRFYVTDNSGDGSADDLVCELTTYSGGGSTTVTRTLISGVQKLKALYGVDDDADGYADRYLTPSQIGTASSPVISVPPGANTPWAKVVSIRIGLMIGSESTLPASVGHQIPAGGNLNVLGLSISKPDTDRLYRVTTTTLALRNLNPVIQRQ
ncbi:PilW family protein [Thiolapillus sp.]